MKTVSLVWHVHELDSGEEDVKLIGVFQTDADARAAVARLSSKPGFRESPEGFAIDAYAIGQDHWTEGYCDG